MSFTAVQCSVKINEEINHHKTKMSTIPVIDLKDLNTPTGRNQIEENIREAFHKYGFLYLINHDFPLDIIENAFSGSKKFFQMELETKRKYQKIYNEMKHGWIDIGQELMKGNTEFREGYDFISWNDSLPLAQDCPEFVESMTQLRNECQSFMKNVFLPLLGQALKLQDPLYFVKRSSHLDNPEVPNECDLRATYYPPLPKELPKGAIRCSEHTDYEICTLLFQDMMGGLEVKMKEGNWIPVPPIPGSIVVNTGDLLQLWTAGYFTANTHRVVIPESKPLQNEPRYSFAFFFPPDNETVVAPLFGLSPLILPKKDEVPTAAPITAIEHIKSRNDSAYKY